MQVSLNWLNEYVDLTGITPEQIAHELTMSGLEVEEIVDLSSSLKGFIVGEIVAVERHQKRAKYAICISIIAVKYANRYNSTPRKMHNA